MEPICFSDITLLITHYNRSRSLERLLDAFNERKITFGEIVVSDDCSKPAHQLYIQSLQTQYQFRFVTGPVNKGLGHNLNKGQDAVKTPLTLYIQEDFIPAPDFAKQLTHALQIMDERADMDMVRFYAYIQYPHLKNYKYGFSEMVFKFWTLNYKKYYYYSDHPHLRRSNFLEKFGRYKEGLSGDQTEYHMMMSFLQKKGKAMFYHDYKGLLSQENSAVEPSTMKRNFWRENNFPLITLTREIYRYLKFNVNYLTGQY